MKTLNDLLKQANGGKPVAEDDIPPPVVVKKAEPKPSASDTTQPSPADVDMQQPPLPIPTGLFLTQSLRQ